MSTKKPSRHHVMSESQDAWRGIQDSLRVRKLCQCHRNEGATIMKSLWKWLHYSVRDQANHQMPKFCFPRELYLVRNTPTRLKIPLPYVNLILRVVKSLEGSCSWSVPS